MTVNRPARLTTRLLAVCLGLYVLVAVGATLFEVVQVSDQSSRAAQADIASLAKTFSPPLEAALWSYDFGQVEILLTVLAEIPSVGKVTLSTSEGKDYEGLPTSADKGPLGPPLTIPLTHERSGSLVFVGTLVVQTSLAAERAQVNDTLMRAVTRTAVVVLLLSIALFFSAQAVVGRPLRHLAEQISRINPQAAVLAKLEPESRAGAEMERVTQAFNGVLDELFALKASLESKVTERTLHLEQTILELSSTRDKLVDSAKMAVLGQLVAGVAHDLNTPLGAAMSASNSALEMLQHFKADLITGPSAEGLFSRMGDTLAVGRQESKVRRQLAREVEEAGLKNQDELVDALVEMGVTPPLGNLVPVLGSAEGLHALDAVHRYASLARSCRVMVLASEKMAAVVENLLRYSRKDSQDTPQPSDLAAQLETILVLFAAALRNGVDVERSFKKLAPVVCRADRLQQVWINLVGNALQAMDGKGKLGLEIRGTDQEAEVSIVNNGPPIPPDIAAQLFTPFFTTKPRGSGTGLGLSICQRIVEEHGGRIDFESVPGRTAFTVYLPFRPVNSPSVS